MSDKADRKLLELAALAAGIQLEWIGEGELASCFDPASENEWWRPLTDAGDALQLACDVPMIDIAWLIPAAWQASDSNEGRMAYVCREIVTKAAAIGEAMKEQKL